VTLYFRYLGNKWALTHFFHFFVVGVNTTQKTQLFAEFQNNQKLSYQKVISQNDLINISILM